MARKCPKCNAEIPSPKDKFCPKCGAEVPPPKQMVLSIVAIVLAVLGFFLVFIWWGLGFLFGVTALILGILGIKREPRGKIPAWIGVGVSIGDLLIAIIVFIITLIIDSAIDSAINSIF